MQLVSHLYVQELAGFDLVGESGRPWCWIRTWSAFAWNREGVIIQLIVFYVPVLLIFVHNIATYLSLLYRLVRYVDARGWYRQETANTPLSLVNRAI